MKQTIKQKRSFLQPDFFSSNYQQRINYVLVKPNWWSEYNFQKPVLAGTPKLLTWKKHIHIEMRAEKPLAKISSKKKIHIEMASGSSL